MLVYSYGNNILLVNLSKALNWRLDNSSGEMSSAAAVLLSESSLTAVSSEECSFCEVMFVICSCLATRTQYRHRYWGHNQLQYSNVYIFLASHIKKTNAAILPLMHGTPRGPLKGPKGSLQNRFNSVFQFCAEIVTLDTLSSMMVSKINTLTM